jgi:hypothetical protein
MTLQNLKPCLACPLSEFANVAKIPVNNQVKVRGNFAHVISTLAGFDFKFPDLSQITSKPFQTLCKVVQVVLYLVGSQGRAKERFVRVRESSEQGPPPEALFKHFLD